MGSRVEVCILCMRKVSQERIETTFISDKRGQYGAESSLSVTELDCVGPGQRDCRAGGLAKGWKVSCCMCRSKHRLAGSTEPWGLYLPQASVPHRVPVQYCGKPSLTGRVSS